MKIQPIETKRLFLRGFEKRDADFAFSIWNDPEMGEYLPDEARVEMTEEDRLEYESLGDDEDCCYLIGERKEDGKRIGTCSFIPLDGGDAIDIAYCVHKAFWRQGYATEMVAGMIDYAKKNNAKKVTVRVNKENTASKAVIAKFDFQVVGEKTYKKRGTDIEYTDYLYELAL